ncbi:hypothetical protein LXL04_024354 [Taraxacum kok-saghyz]
MCRIRVIAGQSRYYAANRGWGWVYWLQLSGHVQEKKGLEMCSSDSAGLPWAILEFFSSKLGAAAGKTLKDAQGDVFRGLGGEVQLLNVLETRKTVLKKEQGMAFARAVAAGFEIEHVANLLSFAECFGASRLMTACLRYMDLWKQKHESGQWVEIEAEDADYSAAMNASGIVLSSHNNESRSEATTPETKEKTSTDPNSGGQQQYHTGTGQIQYPHPVFPPWAMQSSPGSDIVNAICDDEDIKAISFVGSNTAGMHIYSRASAKGKRVQSNMGAKNHGIVMPDANIDATLNALVAAGFGAAGQRCMALSTVIFVGDATQWENELVKRAKKLKVNAGPGCCGFTLPFYAEGSFGISSLGRFFVVPGGGVKGCFGLFSSYGISNSDTVEAACSGCKKSDTVLLFIWMM